MTLLDRQLRRIDLTKGGQLRPQTVGDATTTGDPPRSPYPNPPTGV